METTQLTTSLRRCFDTESHRLVFWYDSEREFEEALSALALDGVSILRLDEIGSLALKIKLELENLAGQYLIYAPFAEPDQEDDWLLDVKLYSHPRSTTHKKYHLSIALQSPSYENADLMSEWLRQ